MLRSFLRGAAFALCLAASPVFAQGQIIIVNANGPGVGFNDPTPAAPVGGNSGTTLGQQRLNVFEFAAGIWEATLKPTTDIFVIAQFVPLAPNVLGSASTTFVFADFPGAELPGTWYASALADKLAGVDLNPGFADIVANFSTNFVFYLGFDNNEGVLVDLLPVVLHELGHGLGFANFVNETAGTLLQGTPDVYSEYTLDVTTNKNWNEMTIAERQASAINVRKVSWSGINVHKDVPQVLQPGEPALTISSPAGLGPFMVGTASFGAQLTAAGTGGEIVQGTPADGCTPLTNASAVAGKIALLDRGTCTFVVKVKNAQNAGAIAAIIADNVAGSPPAGLGGADPTITIPSVRITLADGNSLKAAAPPVVGSLQLDLSILAGTDRVLGLAMLAAFDPVVPGSSISHWDAVAFPNQLMEPAINNDLTSSVTPPQDLTTSLLTDIGWFSDADGVPDGRDACIGSPRSPTVEIEACVSTAPNTVFANGCRVADLANDCAGQAKNRGSYISCIEHLEHALLSGGVLTKDQAKSLDRCAKQSSIGGN